MNVLHFIFWKSTEEGSLEHFTLSKTPDQFILEGVVLLRYDKPTRVHYKVIASSSWLTQSVEVSMVGTEHKNLRLEITPNQEWLLNGRRLETFTGLFDIDLGITPSTNMLPINRLKLEPGQQAELTAVWIRFPDLTVEPLPQRYTRLGANTYRYENADGSFSADLTVDELGVVETYGNFWRRGY